MIIRHLLPPTLLFFSTFQIAANELEKLNHYAPRSDVAENITACDSVLLIEYQSGVCKANIVEVIKDSTQRYHVGQPYSVDKTPCEKDGYRIPDGLLACHSQGNRHIVTRAIYDNKIGGVREPLSLSLQKIRQKLGVKVPEKEIIIAQQPKKKPTLSDDSDASKHFTDYLENKDWNACDAVMLIEYDLNNCASGERIEKIIFDKTKQFAIGQPYPHVAEACAIFRDSHQGVKMNYGMLVCHDNQTPQFSAVSSVHNHKLPITQEPIEDFFKRIRQKTKEKQPPTLSDSKKITSRIQTTTTTTTKHSKTISREDAAKEFTGYLENQDWNACDAVLLVRYDPDNCASGERIDRIFFDKSQQLAVGQPYPHKTNEFCHRYRGSCDDENTIYNVLFCHGGQSPEVNTINVKNNKMPFTDEPVEDFLNRVLNKTPNSNNPIKP